MPRNTSTGSRAWPDAVDAPAVRACHSVREIRAAAWQALAGTDDPFASYAFQTSLEDAGAIGAGTGWSPRHLILDSGDGIGAALPLYLKEDSFGEFVFDWAWAEAWHRAGRRYYPKLVGVVPFSAVTAPKLLVHPDADAALARRALLGSALELTEGIGASSLHLLFIDDGLADAAEAMGFSVRHDCQFHWHNRGYGSFDDFLGAFRSAKRKQVRKERAGVADSGLTIRRHGGASIDGALWSRLHALTARTFLLRGKPPYLDATAFRLLGERLGDALQAFVAWDGDEPVACALFFEGPDVLYGRYWGTNRDVPGLHFELCYYRGIDYSIERGLSRFEPGAQGEHKLTRGFDPVRTVSAHWIAEPALRRPVAAWCAREREAVTEYITMAAGHLPFRRDS